ncbi:hypothetical protein OIU77_009438 [Salix suchowensis]|uniref:Plus3 domain-containing protein n=1 Tax=Salix suchowensis TaxID=1278906 RepID=A0ABQ9AEA3_9ROSI|nr:hypothetical protein OIU77_009438 [Salix suchowensis]
MADLENLLLEAAGKDWKIGKKQEFVACIEEAKTGGDSRDDGSDDDRGYASRKPSGSQVPLKKRLETNERDDEGGSQEEGDYNDGGLGREGESSDESDIGEDLYKDEDDRQKLAQMSELDRELILADRADKKGDKHLTEKIRSKRDNDKPARSRKETPPLPSSRGVRSSARSADRATAKDDALNELRAKRLKQQDPEAHRKLRDASRGSAGSRSFAQVKKNNFTSASLSSSSSESESGSRSHSEDEGSTGDGGMADSDEDGESGSQGPSYEDIKEITIRRTKLAKWLMEPWFEELIIGCFVRVGIGRSKSGPVYRLCMVRNVDAAEPDKPYKLENKSTYKYLNVTWGADSSAARWQMAMVSDSAPTEDEYKQWIREVERGAATVKQMLQEKKSASSRPLNVAAEKDRLRRELEVAQSKHDEAEVERIEARILELEASRQPKVKDVKAYRLEEMNRKNRVENFRNASDLKASKYRSKSWRSWSEAHDIAAVVDSDHVVAAAMSQSGVSATEAALDAAADAGKLVDTSAPVDQGTASNTMHNFELEISLNALHEFRGPLGAQAGFMARKQRIEATIGCQVRENDGRRHAFDLDAFMVPTVLIEIGAVVHSKAVLGSNVYVGSGTVSGPEVTIEYIAF